jgi:cytochrome c-type biogenesis protein CcmH/NrfG
LGKQSFEENAESECERLLQEALKVDPMNPDPLQTLASVRLSQQNPKEALELLNKSYELWREAGKRHL